MAGSTEKTEKTAKKIQTIEEAQEGTILPEDLEKHRLLLGVDGVSRGQEFHSEVNADAIRNFALSMGDDNPLFTDPSYGPTTRWGSQVAPQIMAAIIQAPLKGARVPKELKDQARGIFKGLHIFMSGGTWNWYRPILPGDRLYSFEGEETAELKDSEFGGQTLVLTKRLVKFNQRGDVVGVYRALRILSERKTSAKRAKNMEIEPAEWNDEQIAEVDEAYLAEERRGDEARYWEDVKVGDDMGSIQKGPLTVTEVMLGHVAGYLFHPVRPAASRVAALDRQRMPAAYVKDGRGVPDTALRVHWDDEMAKSVGNPAAYDYGVIREFWLHHFISDWMGDDGFVVRQHDEIRKFNYMGDLQVISGEVTNKRIEDGMYLVDLSVKATNQRGEETAFADVTVSLPSSEVGLSRLPDVPADLAERALRFLRANNLLERAERTEQAERTERGGA